VEKVCWVSRRRGVWSTNSNHGPPFEERMLFSAWARSFNERCGQGGFHREARGLVVASSMSASGSSPGARQRGLSILWGLRLSLRVFVWMRRHRCTFALRFLISWNGRRGNIMSLLIIRDAQMPYSRSQCARPRPLDMRGWSAS